jgi:hypothetical protein
MKAEKNSQTRIPTSLISFLYFGWIGRILKVSGKGNPIENDDVPIIDDTIEVAYLQEKMKGYFKRSSEYARQENQVKPSLLLTLISVWKKELLYSLGLKFFMFLSDMSFPILVQQFIFLIEGSLDQLLLNNGYIISGLLILCQFVYSLSATGHVIDTQCESSTIALLQFAAVAKNSNLSPKGKKVFSNRPLNP